MFAAKRTELGKPMALKQDYFSHYRSEEKSVNAAYQLALHLERHIESIASGEGEKFFCASIENLSDMVSSKGVK